MKRFKSIFWLAVSLCWICLVSTATAGGPENVLLVVNADSASSKMIANHYISMRKIPSTNVVYLNGVPPTEVIPLDQFKKLILEPVLTALVERQIQSHVDYVIYSSDFPTGVRVNEHVKKLGESVEEKGIGFNRKLYLPIASINALTYYAVAVLADDVGYLNLNSNSYFRGSAARVLLYPFVGQLQRIFDEAVKEIQGDDEELYPQAEQKLLALAKANPRQVAVAYRLVQCYARMGDKRKATNWLGRARRAGWQYRQYTKDDPLLANLQSDPLFKGVLSTIPDELFEFAPTLGFRNRYKYGPNGMLNQFQGQGNRFFLSTVLAVTRNYGNTEQEALDQLQRTVRADGTDPTGSFYFTTTSDVRTRTRKQNYEYAISRLKKMGYGAEIVSGNLPENKSRVLGATIGTPGFNWKKSGSRFVPGAIGDNLTSYGGRMPQESQTKLTEFLANGAAGGSGTVTEPYALQAKFPHPMIHVHYARGCTLAEAFYQSVAGPSQLLIVGDPLCRPFGRVPEFGVTGVSLNQKVSGTIKLNPIPDQTTIRIAGYQLFVDGQLVHVQGNGAEMKIDTTDMSDGHHEFRIVAIANTLLESTAGVVIPLQVDNSGHQVKLSAASDRFLSTDKITLKATSNVGDAIALVHNGRTIAQELGREVVFEVDASWVGRGPVQLEAVAMASAAVGQKQEIIPPVASQPLNLFIDGRISQRKKYENPPKTKKPIVINAPRQRSRATAPLSTRGGLTAPPRPRPPR